MTTTTVRTILDAPTLPLFDEEEIRYQRWRTDLEALLAHPDVVAVLDRLPHLTEAERQRLDRLWVANYQTHRLDQLRIGHRTSRQDPRRAMLLRAVADHVWQVADRTGALPWAGAHAVADAAYAAACGSLLTADEARLFTKPWTDVLGDWDDDQCPDCECCTRRQCSLNYCSGRCPCTAD